MAGRQGVSGIAGTWCAVLFPRAAIQQVREGRAMEGALWEGGVAVVVFPCLAGMMHAWLKD